MDDRQSKGQQIKDELETQAQQREQQREQGRPRDAPARRDDEQRGRPADNRPTTPPESMPSEDIDDGVAAVDDELGDAPRDQQRSRRDTGSRRGDRRRDDRRDRDRPQGRNREREGRDQRSRRDSEPPVESIRDTDEKAVRALERFMDKLDDAADETEQYTRVVLPEHETVNFAGQNGNVFTTEQDTSHATVESITRSGHVVRVTDADGNQLVLPFGMVVLKR